MKSVRKIALLLFLIFTIILGTSCTKKDTTVKIGILPNLDAIPIIVAEKNGYFNENIKIIYFSSALDRDTALQTGNLDGTASDILSALFLRNEGFDVKITSKTQGEFAIVTNSSSNVSLPQEINDGSIGISANTVIEYITDVFTNTYDINNLQKMAIPQIPLRLEMLKNNEIDFATLPEPLASSITIDGGTILSTSTELNTYPSVMIFNTKVIENKSDVLDSFYKGYNEAVDYLNNTPVEEYFDFVATKANFPQNIYETFSLPKYKYAYLPTEAEYNNVLNWMIDNELITNEYTYSNLIYPVYAQ